MKAFLIGLLTLVAVAILSGVGILLLPLLLILTLFLRILIGFALVLFAIWALGKCVILIWSSLSRNKKADA